MPYNYNKSFVATSGNTATLTGKKKGNRIWIDVSWRVPPSKRDVAECDDMWKSSNPQVVTLSSLTMTPEEAKRAGDAFLSRSDN